MLNEFIDEIAAASFLKVTPRTVRLWRRTRGLPFFKLSAKVVRFRERDLVCWVEKSRTQIRAR